MLQGRLEGGEKIPTIAPNDEQDGESVADGILIHPMNLEARRSPAHGNQMYVGSEGCQGPVGEEAMTTFMKGKKLGEKYSYELIRPTAALEITYEEIKDTATWVKTNVPKLTKEVKNGANSAAEWVNKNVSEITKELKNGAMKLYDSWTTEND